VQGRNQWQRVFRTPQASYYVIVPSRGAQVIRDVLGQARPEVWLSDLWSALASAGPTNSSCATPINCGTWSTPASVATGCLRRPCRICCVGPKRWPKSRQHREKLFVFLERGRCPLTTMSRSGTSGNSVVHRKVSGRLPV
jgi:hypothetical protein